VVTSRLASKQRPLALAAALLSVTALAACTTAGADDESGAEGKPPKSAATLTVEAQGSQRWDPSQPVVIKADDGRLTNVDVRSRDGQRVIGKVSDSGNVWRSTDPLLKYDTTYKLQARAVDAAGLATKTSGRFHTVKPKNRVYTDVSPFGGAVVGVGMPIIVSFSAPVPNRAEAERQLNVDTSPQTVGSWYWVSDQMVRWRPKEYWKSGTDVVVTSKLAGVDLGDGTWGDDDDRVNFSVGERLISTVDIANHRMVVEQNGSVVRRIPVTTGKAGWDTRNGIKVIISKDRNVVMDAATLDVDEGDPEYYRLDVEYAMRLTWSGEYVHAAPWSVSSQGDDNVSHGCTGMSTANAAWFYNLSKPGDIVQYVGGPRGMEPWNGYTDWTMSWSDWKQGSALS